MIPTVIRKKKIPEVFNRDLAQIRDIGYVLGGAVGVVTDFVLGMGSVGFAVNGDPKYLLTWLGANAASGTYELLRYKYKKVKERLSKRGDLEEKLEGDNGEK